MREGLRFRGGWGGGAGAVEPVVLPVSVEGPVGIPVVGEADGAEVEDGVGAVLGPAHAGLLHAVLDEVAAGALDDAGADRPATLEVPVVAHVGGVAPIVADGGGDGVVLRGRERRP